MKEPHSIFGMVREGHYSDFWSADPAAEPARHL